MNRNILHDLVLPSCKIVIEALAVSAVVAVVVGLLSNVSYILNIFLWVSLLESAVMMIVGPGSLFRSQTTIENRGSRILLAGVLLFLLTMLTSLAA